MVLSMAGVSRSDRLDGAHASAQRARRGGWFSRAIEEPRCEDQEAEVWAALYARPDTPERTVRRVQPMEPPKSVDWIGPAEHEWIDPVGRDERAARIESAPPGERAAPHRGAQEGPAGPEGEPEIRIERAERAWDRPAA